MNENKIKDSISKIEVNQYQKNKMYNNILEKANNKQSINPSRYYLRYGLSFCCLLIIVSLIILPNFSNNDTIQTSNPFMEVENAQAFKTIGIDVDAPDNATDKSYIIIDNQIAYITFKIDGIDYEIKASQQQGDFTGISGSIVQQESIDSKLNANLYIINTKLESYYLINWTDGKVIFNLYSNQCSDSSLLINIYNSIKY